MIWGLRKRIYLDYAAAMPVSPNALRAFETASRFSGNPSSAHEEGRNARVLLEDARKRIAALLGAKAENVYFVSGATEGNNLAVRGMVAAAQKRGVVEPHVLIEEGAHASLTALAEALTREGANVEWLSVKGGALSTRELKEKVRPCTVLVAVQAVCGETGSRHDTRDMQTILKKEAPHAKLHVDASQLPLAESADMTRLGADILVLDAQKVGGVRGVGILAVQKGIELAPLLSGGSQERGLRPGTPSPALARAFVIALEEARANAHEFTEKATRLRTDFIKTLKAQVPQTVVHGGIKTVPHIMSFSLPGLDTDYLQALLDKEGVAVSTKSACETDSPGSRAVLAQTGSEEESRSTLRVSFGPMTTEHELQVAGKKLVDAVRFLEHNAIK